MFDFTTTTIINSDTFNGKSNYKDNGDYLQFPNGLNIKKKNITRVIYSKPVQPKLAKVTFTIPTVVVGNIYRIYLYLKLRGSNNPLYANDTIYKGKPLYFEVEATATTDSAMATALVKQVENVKFNLAKFDGKDIVTVNASGTTLTFTTNSEFITFDKAVFEEYIPKSETNSEGRFEEKAVGEIDNGNMGFGTYAHLRRDVQLPTDANIRYKHLYEDEDIEKQASYYQYIITERTKRNLHGQGAVGQVLNSETTHVLWVKQLTSFSDTDTYNNAIFELLKTATITDTLTDGIIENEKGVTVIESNPATPSETKLQTSNTENPTA